MTGVPFYPISDAGLKIAAHFYNHNMVARKGDFSAVMSVSYTHLDVYKRQRFTNTKLKDEEIKTYANDISITPLSIPMLCGPGAIAVSYTHLDVYKRQIFSRLFISSSNGIVINRVSEKISSQTP